MKKLIITLMLALGCAVGAQAAGGEGAAWDKAPSRTNDLPALQNGAKLFVNYCLNCHSANYMRYNRMKDLGLTDDEIKKNMVFAAEKVGETMKISLDPRQAKEWFGTQPPDLSVVARSRAAGGAGGGTGADYLYTLWRTFYRDETKPSGWNNLVFPDIAMPHAMWELQGQRVPKFVEEKDAHDPKKTVHRFGGWEQITPGKLDEHGYDEAVGDLVAFLQYMAEPAQGKRVQIGVWVLLFLGLLTVFTWRLNAAYWKDVK